MTTWRG